MRNGPVCALVVLFVDVVVYKAGNRLKEEAADNDDADNWVAVAGCELEHQSSSAFVLGLIKSATEFTNLRFWDYSDIDTKTKPRQC